MLEHDVWRKLKRGPQVVTLKDAALVSAFTGLQSGDTVVDAGSGSGFLATYLGSVVAPNGRVASYERRNEFAELSRENVEKAGLAEIVEIREKDVFEGIEEREVDLVTLDLAEPEKALEAAKAALKERGWIAAYLPHVEQVKAFVLEAGEKKLRLAKTIECSFREWLVRSYGCRPENSGIVFTGFLVFLQKVPEAEFEQREKEKGLTKKGRRAERIREKLGQK